MGWLVPPTFITACATDSYEKRADLRILDRRLHGCPAGTSLELGANSVPSACGSPAPRAERFAPTLALAEKTFRGTIGPEHAEFYFFRKVAADPDAEDYRILEAARTMGPGPLRSS
jgi:hypothetical protein